MPSSAASMSFLTSSSALIAFPLPPSGYILPDSASMRSQRRLYATARSSFVTRNMYSPARAISPSALRRRFSMTSGESVPRPSSLRRAEE